MPETASHAKCLWQAATEGNTAKSEKLATLSRNQDKFIGEADFRLERGVGEAAVVVKS